MIVPLPEELRTAIAAHPGAPLEILDDRTSTAYVLIRADQLEKLKELVESDDLAATYPAQIESAMRAGWGDPAMDDYNDYDSHRQP
ncbi:MAG: hypothetical protein ACYC35_11255 [Pirellulales bacterium]